MTVTISRWSTGLADDDKYDKRFRAESNSFEITKERDAPGITKLIDTGKVTVTYKPTGVERHYRDGIVPPPHVEFDRELKKDKFKMR